MPDLDLIQQTEHSLAALRDFAQKSNNAQLLAHLQQLELALRALTAAGGAYIEGGVQTAGGDFIGRDKIDQSLKIVGHDINIIINQVLPADLRRPLETVQKQWGAAHLEIRRVTEQGQGGHVFLSYTRADMEPALRLRRALEQAGHVVWQDLTAIKGGDEWIKSIEAGVERSYALVTVVSAAAQKSEWVQIEYLHAKRRGKLIIPIKVDESEIPTLLLSTNVLQGCPDLEDGIRQLVQAVPPPPSVPVGAGLASAPSPDRRALELRYLDGLLLEHSAWQEVYTPMAGVGQLRHPDPRAAHSRGTIPAGGIRMRTAPTTIDVGYLGRGLSGSPAQSANEGGVVFGERTEEKRYEADILPAVAEMRWLVILGDPGAGKTTTLWKVLSDFTLKAKSAPAAPLPVFVRLGAVGTAGLEAAICTGLGALAPHHDTLLSERRLAFLLDGLNELPSASREACLNDIKQLAKRCQREDLALVVTCRELDYTSALNLGLPGRVTIQPLDLDRIRHFVSAYIVEPPGKGDELFLQLAGAEDVWRKWQQAGASWELFWTVTEVPRENPNVDSCTSQLTVRLFFRPNQRFENARFFRENKAFCESIA